MPADHQAPLSKLDDIPALLRSAVEDEIRPQTEAMAELRAALDGYEAALRLVAEAHVTGKVAAALGLPVPEMRDASDARNVLIAAMGTLAQCADGVARPEATKSGDEPEEEDREAAPEPSARHGPAVEAIAHAAEAASAEHEVANGAPAESAEHEVENGAPSEIKKNGALSQDAVRAFFEARAAMPVPSRPTSTSTQAREPQALRSLLQRAGEVPALSMEMDGIDELDKLDEITADTTKWASLSATVQQLWLSYLVARTRALKDWLYANSPALKSRLRTVIRRLPEFASEARPGYVNGLKQAHEPAGASWEADARDLSAELQALVAPKAASPPAPVEQVSKPTAKKVKALESAEPEPIEWPLRDRVGGMRGVLFGGEPREEARQHLQRMLGNGTLDWPESHKPRRVDALATSIASGKFDVLLVLRQFVSHKESNKLIEAARAHGTPFALVDSGYGIAAVREAIETALAER